MWNYSSVNDKWEKRVDKLDKRIYNYLRQEIEDVRFYSKCLDGISYVPVPDLKNLYDVINYKTNDTYKIDSKYSPYFNGNNSNKGISIASGDLSDNGTQYRYNEEYGHSLKNLFTPKRLIEDSTNYLTVDIATTDPINLYDEHSEIDGIRLKEGHRVLVKNNITNITLDSSVDAEQYFNHNYYLVKTIGNKNTYYYFNSENGIYKYSNGKLVRENDLDSYLTNIRYSIHIKLGSNNHRQYFLSRLRDGNFPLTSNNDPIEFTIKKNHIVRNSLEYRNTLDNEFYSGFIQKPEEIRVTDKRYQIPNRLISVGDFGSIINYQDNYPNVIKNKFKEKLNDITGIYNKYLIIGDNGTLLTMGKIDMKPKYIELDTFEQLNSIDFIDNYRGTIVGNNGFILNTTNQYNWNELPNDIENNLNKIHYRDLSNAVIIGDNGIVNKMTISNDVYKLEQVDLEIKSDLFNRKVLIDDLTSICELSINRDFFEFNNTTSVDIERVIGSSDFTLDFRFKASSLGNTLLSFLDDNYGMEIYLDNNKIKVNINNNSEPQLVGDINIYLSTWYHVMITRKRGVYQLFINQRLSDSIDNGFDGNFDSASDRITLGGEYKGVIDQIRLFNKCLNVDEVSDYSNNYTLDLDHLLAWYKLSYINGKRRDYDLVYESIINYTGDSTYSEIHSGVAISGNNSISIILDVPRGYSDQEVYNQLFIDLEGRDVKNISYDRENGYIYGVGSNLFRIDTSQLDLDLFNQINVLDTEIEDLLDEQYNNITLDRDDQIIYLISGSDNQIESIELSQLCISEPHDPLSECDDVYADISGTSSISIENDYIKYNGVDENKIEFIKSKDQKIVELDIVDTINNGSLAEYKEVYCSFKISELINGHIEFSMNGNDYTRISNNGDHLILLSVGTDSKLYIKTTLVDPEYRIGDKIKGIVSDIKFYDKDCVNINPSKVYDDGTNIQKLYFTQFDTQSQLEKLGTGVNSKLELISLNIDGEEMIDHGKYIDSSLPKELEGSDFEQEAKSRCFSTGSLCNYIDYLNNNTIDRIRYGFGLTVSGYTQYEYIDNNNGYGLLEGLSFNSIQSFGIDRPEIMSNGTSIKNPFYLSIDFNKSFEFIVDSTIDGSTTRSVIKWDPSTCEKSYTLNGVEEEGTGFIMANGEGEFYPNCKLVSTCDNSDIVEPVLDIDYWDRYNSKLLFMNYDMASKLYFFDTNTGEYQLPYPVTISNIRKLKMESIPGQVSWLDYSKDTMKDFGYQLPKNDINTVKFNSIFSESTGITVVNRQMEITNSLSDINNQTDGLCLLPHLIDSITISTLPTIDKDIYLYDNYMIIRAGLIEASEGDIIRIETPLVSDNLMVIHTWDGYIYLKTTFNQSLTNRLVSWNKPIKLINLNRFNTIDNLVERFNLHPISVGYSLESLTGGRLSIVPKFNSNTSYYNLQCRASVTNNINNVSDNDILYKEKVLNFGYSASYNILDYLSKNPIFEYDYELGILPSYNFTNNNNGVLYTIENGKISFNSRLKSEWESIPKYTFIDIIFDQVESTDQVKLTPILVLNKYYDDIDNRYIIETYNYYGLNYNMDNLGSDWVLRVRNKLGEVSEDLQKLNNIQRSISKKYQDKNEYITNLTSDLNFKPNTDSYTKALLNQGDIKEYLTGIVYTDYKNELAANIINLPDCDSHKITGISEYYVNCSDCEYDDYILFDDFNQYSVWGATATESYTNRKPFSTYGYHNNIRTLNIGTQSVVSKSIDTGTQSGVLEFTIQELENSVIEVLGHTISYLSEPNQIVKLPFSDSPIEIEISSDTPDDNKVSLVNIRVGTENCLDNCYKTKLHLESHNLTIGDGFYVDIKETIYDLDPQYESNFYGNTYSGWCDNNNELVTTNNGVLELDGDDTTLIYLPLSDMVVGDTYRLSFDYHIEKSNSGGTPSISPSFGEDINNIDTIFGNYYDNESFEHVETNFIPTSDEIYMGFKINANGSVVKIGQVSIFKVTDIGEYYNGYRVVQDIVNDNEVVINTDYRGTIRELSATYSFVNRCGDTVIASKVVSDLGLIRKCTFDPYLNYGPIDIFELGKDDKIKQSIEVKPNDWTENEDNSVSILDTIDMYNYRFRLIDDLSIVDISDKYSWILEAEIRNALIGKNDNGLVWYKGIWDCGRWFGGTWYSGEWRSGEWYDGIWNNSDIKDSIIKASIEVLRSNEIKSIWHNGNFRQGIWNDGVFRKGNFYNGTWNNGLWNDGTWHSGTWNNGQFKRGTWIDGTWNNGIFNSSLGHSSWFNGKWNTGHFENGKWYNGQFNSIDDTSIFGSKSTSSRPAIWESGQFTRGEFGSTNNSNMNTVWKTGYWANGTWNSGTAHQINWNNGLWNNGVVKDIEVLSFYGDNNNVYYFTLKGDWKFNKGDTFWIIDNNLNNNNFGTNEDSIQYKVSEDYISLENGRYTKVFVDRVPAPIVNEINSNGKYVIGYENNNIPSDSSIKDEVLTKIVSHFSKAQWMNGQFKNGIFEGDFFKNGILENGVFKSGNFGY